MNFERVIHAVFVLMVFLLVSCAGTTSPEQKKNLLPDGRMAETYDDFVNRHDYRETRDVWYSDGRIAQAGTSNSKIVIHRNSQRGKLYVDGRIAMDFPVCTGKKSHRTPKGSFTILEKKRHHQSSLYGSVYKASGGIAVYDATPGTRVPAGGKYVPASMPMWMRIHGGVGLHIGVVWRDASSHGCIRVPEEPCTILFDKCGVGTKVDVVD